MTTGNPFALLFVMFGCVQGITQGFSISMAKRFGCHDEEGLKQDVGGSIFLCLVLGILLTSIGMMLCKPILRLLHTPQDMMEMAQIYLRTLYGGVCISFCYNMTAAFLRAAGDSGCLLQLCGGVLHGAECGRG